MMNTIDLHEQAPLPVASDAEMAQLYLDNQMQENELVAFVARLNAEPGCANALKAEQTRRKMLLQGVPRKVVNRSVVEAIQAQMRNAD